MENHYPEHELDNTNIHTKILDEFIELCIDYTDPLHASAVLYYIYFKCRQKQDLSCKITNQELVNKFKISDKTVRRIINFFKGEKNPDGTWKRIPYIKSDDDFRFMKTKHKVFRVRSITYLFDNVQGLINNLERVKD